VIKNIVTSLSAKLIVLFATLGVVVLNTRFLGQEGQGEAALINLGILLIVSVSNIVGGGALVFLLPRIGTKAATGPAIAWAIFSSVLAYPILKGLDFIPDGLLVHICLLGFIQSLFFFVHQAILAKEKIARYNILISFQLISLLLSLTIFYVVLDQKVLLSFIQSLYISFGATCLLSIYMSGSSLDDGKSQPWKKTFGEIFPLGSYTQGGNILHLLNLRVYLIILEKAGSLFSVGIFSLAIYAAEAVWNIAKSLSLVLSSRISNSTDQLYIRSLTLSFLKISPLLTLPLVLIASVLPDEFFKMIFGKDLQGLHSLILICAPAIWLHSVTVIISHYFSGTGHHKHNMWGSAFGLLTGFSSSLFFIPMWSVTGAAISFSAGLVANFTYHVLTFHKKQRIQTVDFTLSRNDFNLIK